MKPAGFKPREQRVSSNQSLKLHRWVSFQALSHGGDRFPAACLQNLEPARVLLLLLH